MRHLGPGRVALRLNWSMVDDPALFQFGGKRRTGRDPSITAANAGERLHMRVERQTLSRLPRSGSVLFTIRVHSYPLARVAAVPDAAAGLAEAVRALPPEVGAHKSLPAFRDALLAYLGAGRGPAPVPGPYDHDRVTPFGERLHAAPVSMLWSA